MLERGGIFEGLQHAKQHWYLALLGPSKTRITTEGWPFEGPPKRESRRRAMIGSWALGVTSGDHMFYEMRPKNAGLLHAFYSTCRRGQWGGRGGGGKGLRV